MNADATTSSHVVQGAILGRGLVFGAGGGIGSAVVEAFRRIGMDVVASDLRSDDPSIHLCDVTRAVDVEAVFSSLGGVGPVHVVAAHGVASVSDLASLDEPNWRSGVDVNLTGTYHILRESSKRLEAGSTVTVLGSQAGLRGAAGWASYSATKFGVIGLAQSAAQELASRGVRVNIVCPGNVETEMSSKLHRTLAERAGSSEDVIRARYESMIPLGRFATADEIASVCLFLASDLASYVCGSTIVVDGGELS